jgi:protein O-mannosyl-transferase
LTGCKPAPFRTYLAGFFLILMAIIIVYSNTFSAGWQFDDLPNIVNNRPLHIDNMMPETLWGTFFAKPGHHTLYRPVACLSFAMNWYVGGSNPVGYHLVNIAIHVSNAFLLFVIILQLLTSRNVNRRVGADSAGFIALLAAMLWALNPLQTMAVTYIVQRMAELAAFFYLFGVLFYIRLRVTGNTGKRVMFTLLCCLAYFLAMGSKENAAVFPMGLLLIEAAFFQDLSDANVRRKMAILSSLVFLGIVVIGSMVFLNGSFFLNLTESGSRFHTPLQRLITQPRVLLFYLSQLVYPLPGRLSIEHDIFFSPSLLQPWTTLPSILLVIGVIAVSILRFHKCPLVSFSILFFFVNHAIESSIINLELVFEHRNYLPSLFLFLAPAWGIDRLVRSYRQRNRAVYFSMITCIIMIVTTFGFWTYQRNSAWASSKTLWLDAMKKAPGQARPINHLAIDLAWSKNPSLRDLQLALRMFEKSRSLATSRKDLEADIAGNIGNILFRLGALDKAIAYQKEALTINPRNPKLRLDLVKSLVLAGQWKEAEVQAAKLLPNDRRRPAYDNINGFILLWKHQPERALKHFRNALRLAPFKPNILLNIGKALSMSGSYENAEWFFQLVHKIDRDDPMPLFALIENGVRAGKRKKAELYTKALFSRFPMDFVIRKLEALSDNRSTIPFSADTIATPIKRYTEYFCSDRDNEQPKE